MTSKLPIVAPVIQSQKNFKCPIVEGGGVINPHNLADASWLSPQTPQGCARWKAARTIKVPGGIYQVPLCSGNISTNVDVDSI